MTDNSGATAELPRDVVVGNRAPTRDHDLDDPGLAHDSRGRDVQLGRGRPRGPHSADHHLGSRQRRRLRRRQRAQRAALVPRPPARTRSGSAWWTVSEPQRRSRGRSRSPTAHRPRRFIQSPAHPSPFETVKFTSTSGDLDGTVASQEWDTDNDGNFDDGTANTATRKFTESGAFTVRLRVTDDTGAVSTGAQTVVVGNRPPVVSFGYSPVQPIAGQPVTFYSTSTDPDTPITSYAWDLDGDGRFGDGAGTTATGTYPAGSHTVGLMVTDSEGASPSPRRRSPSPLPAAPSTPAPAAQAGAAPDEPVPSRPHLGFDPSTRQQAEAVERDRSDRARPCSFVVAGAAARSGVRASW